MNTYRVTWTIDVDANSAEGAAIEALKIHRDPESEATVFDVQKYNREDGWVNLMGASKRIDVADLDLAKYDDGEDAP